MNRTRRDIVAAALAAAGPEAFCDPIQLQVRLFLIDRKALNRIGGPCFDFRPGPLGPTDDSLYDDIGTMAATGEAVIDQLGPTTLFRLTEAGRAKGEAVLATLDPPVADYFGRVARWTSLVPYGAMLRSIFREYPEMATKCVVKKRAKVRRTQPDAERGLRPFVEGFVRAFDFFGVMRHPQSGKSKSKSDAEAIEEIWHDVGGFIEDAMVTVGHSERLW